MIGIISCHPIFNETIFIISKRFNFEIVNDFNPKPNDIYLVFGGHEKAVELYSAQKASNNAFGYIIYNSEQTSSDFWKNKYYTMLCRDNVVFNYSNDLAKDLEKKFKIPTHSFFTWDYLTWADPTPHEKYDIVFLGAKSEAREELHNQLVSAFPDKKILFHYDGQYLSPEKITSLLHNTDVLINFPYYKDNILATHRINKGISCKCKVISTYSSDNDMNDYYNDYIYFTNNIPKFLKKAYETGFEPKKNWDQFTEEMGKKFLPHNLQIIKHIEQKLLDRNEKLNKETAR
jgi:hypothetical protein